MSFKAILSCGNRLLLLTAAWSVSGCSIGYYLHSARGQADLMARRTAIAELVADPGTPAELRQRLLRVRAAREFASDELGLPQDKGYRSYADLERPFAVWSVTATEEFSLAPLSWCFPIAGCVSYRGYFDESKARRFAEGLRRRGLDVAVRGVAAYSTLGYFDDPVLNTMLHWDDARLVAIIFHELAHQRLYVKNDTPFNESFARVVEEAGMARWTATHGEPGELRHYLQGRNAEEAFSQLVDSARTRLADVYASQKAAPEMRQDKSRVFADLVAAYETLRASGAIHDGYTAWFRQDLNNAHIAAVGVYQQWLPALRKLLQQSGGDLGHFYAAAERLAQLSPAERADALQGLNPD